jgi:hypothetical protein
VPVRAYFVIEGHQGLISPILTRYHESSINYQSIYSIYPVRFAASGAAIARLTRDNGPFGDWDLHEIRDRTVIGIGAGKVAAEQ